VEALSGRIQKKKIPMTTYSQNAKSVNIYESSTEWTEEDQVRGIDSSSKKKDGQVRSEGKEPWLLIMYEGSVHNLNATPKYYSPMRGVPCETQVVSRNGLKRGRKSLTYPSDSLIRDGRGFQMW